MWLRRLLDASQAMLDRHGAPALLAAHAGALGLLAVDARCWVAHRFAAAEEVVELRELWDDMQAAACRAAEDAAQRSRDAAVFGYEAALLELAWEAGRLRRAAAYEQQLHFGACRLELETSALVAGRRVEAAQLRGFSTIKASDALIRAKFRWS
jgi:hypothetical protein